MPELPEVETVRLFLESQLLFKIITNVKVISPKSFIGDSATIVNRRIISFHRHGKYLTINLSNGLSLLVHLKMTGQLIYQDNLFHAFGHPTKDMLLQSHPHKSTRLVFEFSNKSTLFFNDQRKFGWFKVIDSVNLSSHHSHLGPDILNPQFIPTYFYSQLQKTSRPIKIVLLDQSKFAGIGNIYASDSLFDAKINPSIPANKISLAKSKKLHLAIVNIIKESISRGGSTARDNKYLRPDGTFGSQQYHFRVYQRMGEKCLKCSSVIKRIIQAGRSTFFCPYCQS